MDSFIISEFATKVLRSKMEVDSDSEQQPSGSGTVSKDKKRCLPLFLTNTNRSSFVLQQMCRNVVLSRFEWRSGMLWRSGLGTLLSTTVPFAGFLGKCSAMNTNQRYLKLAVPATITPLSPHYLMQPSCWRWEDDAQEPHHGPVHRVPGQPGLGHQWGVHCGMGHVSGKTRF